MFRFNEQLQKILRLFYVINSQLIIILNSEHKKTLFHRFTMTSCVVVARVDAAASVMFICLDCLCFCCRLHVLWKRAELESWVLSRFSLYAFHTSYFTSLTRDNVSIIQNTAKVSAISASHVRRERQAELQYWHTAGCRLRTELTVMTWHKWNH